MKVIGISGKARHGKDTCAQLLVELAKERGLTAIVWPMATALKARVYACAGGTLTYEDVWVTKPPEVRKALQIEGTEKGRMEYGEEFWLLHSEAFYKVLNEAVKIDLIIIPDCRFPNEVKFAQLNGRAPEALAARLREQVVNQWALPLDEIETLINTDPHAVWENEMLVDRVYHEALMREETGYCFRIASDRPTLTGEAAQHLSETALDNAPHWAYSGIIHNHKHVTLDNLKDQMRRILDTVIPPAHDNE